VHALGQEYWYEIFESLFLLLLAVLALEAAQAELARRGVRAGPARAATAAGLAALLVLFAANGRAPDPFAFPESWVWHRMRLPDGEPYLTPEDRAAVRDALEALPGERPSVRFQPAAEGLFYADLDGRAIRIVEPLFHEATPDWTFLRTSRWRSSRRAERAAIARAGSEAGLAAARFRERGARERWYALAGGLD
jgi:hypothetical protein